MPLFGKKVKSSTTYQSGNYKSNLKTKSATNPITGVKRGKVAVTEITDTEKVGASPVRTIQPKATRTVIKTKEKNGERIKTEKTKDISMRRAERIMSKGSNVKAPNPKKTVRKVMK